MQPLLSPVPYFEICRHPFVRFYDLLVQIRHPDFETVCHRELVRIHEEFVWKSRSHFNKLEATKFVRLRHQGRQIPPALQYPVASIPPKKAVLKKRIDVIAREKR